MKQYFIFITNTVVLTLMPKVALACALSVSNVDAGSVKIDSSTPQIQTVARVTEDCPDSSGYNITISSLNGSLLKSTSASYSYQASYNHSAFQSLQVPYSINYGTPGVRTSNPIDLLLTPHPGAVAGRYSDSLTVTISAR
jgi:hypothetical protein